MSELTLNTGTESSTKKIKLINRLGIQLAIWVFFSIVLIETIILIPSYLKYENELLSGIESQSRMLAEFMTKHSVKEHTTGEYELVADTLLEHKLFGGIIIRDSSGREAHRSGLFPAGLDASILERTEEGRFLDVSWDFTAIANSVSIAARLNTGHVQAELNSYVLRIAGLVLVISLAVCGATMIVFHILALKRLSRLRNVMWDSINLPMETEFDHIETGQKDELGDVIDTFNDMMDKLRDSRQALLESNKTLEHKVRERTHEFLTAKEKAERAQDELRDHRDNLQTVVARRTADLEAAKLAAESANHSKSEFLSKVSHELRTPMHAVLSYSELGLIKPETTSPDELRKYFDRIHTSGKRLLVLLNDLLDLSKLEAGKMDMDFSEHDLRKTVDDCVVQFEAILKDKNLKIVEKDSGVSGTACFDEPRMMQVITNLLSNAVKFASAGTEIKVSITDSSMKMGRRKSEKIIVPSLILSVSDQGIGIPEDELDTVFDKFIQSSKTTADDGGTGLGLAICKEIIEAHGGEIVAKNKESGGAEFIVTLPRQQIEQLQEV